MIAGNGQCRGFMAAVAALVVLLTLLLFFAWSRKRDSPKPEPPLHTAGTGQQELRVHLCSPRTLGLLQDGDFGMVSFELDE